MPYFNANDLKELDELSIGGRGIVKKKHGFDAAQTSRVLVIGLGGMGLKTVTRLKKELRERVGTIDDSFLRILAIDTSMGEIQAAISSGELKKNEAPDINNGSLTQALQARPELRPLPLNEVLPNGFGAVLSGGGANQIRLAGRLTFLDGQLFGSICTAIVDAVKGLQDFASRKLDVHIVAGIGGGSGSGMIVDMPYIVRHIVGSLGIAPSSLRIYGHVYLPNAYKGISSPNSAQRNGYAALKEIDYFMKLESIGETYDAVYPTVGQYGGHFSSQSNIFTQCTLIGGKINQNIIFDDCQAKAISVCVDDLVNQCTHVHGNFADGAQNQVVDGSITDFFTSDAFHVNTTNALDQIILQGAAKFPPYGNYNYNYVGSTAIKFPTEAIIEKFVGEVSSKAYEMLKKNTENLTGKDVDEFENGLLKPDDVIKNFEKKLETKLDDILSDSGVSWTKNSIQDNTHTAPLQVAVTKALEDFDKDGNYKDQRVADANAKARAIFVDSNKGPFYLEKLLTTTSMGGGQSGFYQRIRNYSNVVSKKKQDFVNSLNEFNKEKAELIANMIKTFGMSGARIRAFKDVLKNIYLTTFKIELCDKLNTHFYADLNDRVGVAFNIKESLDSNFIAYADIFAKMCSIMQDNAKIADSKLGDNAKDDTSSIFHLSDNSLTSLKATITRTVDIKLGELKDAGILKFASELTANLIDNKDKWQLTPRCEYGASIAAASFREFIASYDPFSDIINRTMLDYFEQAYQGQNDAAKDQAVRTLMNHANFYSEVMCNFWHQPHFDIISVDSLRYSYLVLPDSFKNDASGWGAKFKDAISTSKNNNVYYSPDQNAIYCYTLYAKMPIWVHEDLIKYEHYYNQAVGSTLGLHINENPKTKPAMKEYPALMIPSQWWRAQQGMNEYKNDIELKIMDEIAKLFRYAKKHGIVHKDENVGVYVIEALTNKPDMNDGRSRASIDSFVKTYFLENTQSNGTITAEPNVWLKATEKFGKTTHNIVNAYTGFAMDKDENAILLLRKQMKLLQILRDEVEYYKNNIYAPINSEMDKAKRVKNIQDFTKYMLYGTVFENLNTWYYRLGQVQYPIISIFEAEDLSDYMEIAACEKLWKCDGVDKHLETMETYIKNCQIRLLQRNANPEAMKAYMALGECYKSLMTKCVAVLTDLKNRVDNGNVLSKAELDRQFFYNTMYEAAKKQVSMLG